MPRSRHAVLSTPTIPVGPSYFVGRIPSRAASSGSEAPPTRRTGRVWGTSASSAPRVRTSVVWVIRLSSRIASVYARHLRCGSGATPMMKSRGRSDDCEIENSVAGQTTSRSVSEPVLKRTYGRVRDRKSTRLNSSHGYISYAVFCLKKKKKQKYYLGAEENQNITDGVTATPLSTITTTGLNT